MQILGLHLQRRCPRPRSAQSRRRSWTWCWRTPLCTGKCMWTRRTLCCSGSSGLGTCTCITKYEAIISNTPVVRKRGHSTRIEWPKNRIQFTCRAPCVRQCWLLSRIGWWRWNSSRWWCPLASAGSSWGCSRSLGALGTSLQVKWKAQKLDWDRNSEIIIPVLRAEANLL